VGFARITVLLGKYVHTFGREARTPTYTTTPIDHRAVRIPPGGVTVLVDENYRDERVNANERQRESIKSNKNVRNKV